MKIGIIKEIKNNENRVRLSPSGVHQQNKDTVSLLRLRPFQGHIQFNLDTFAIVVGVIWFGIGIIYLITTTRCFTKEPVNIPFEELENQNENASTLEVTKWTKFKKTLFAQYDCNKSHSIAMVPRSKKPSLR